MAPAMRFAVQRGGVWLSHSYEMGYGCRRREGPSLKAVSRVACVAGVERGRG